MAIPRPPFINLIPPTKVSQPVFASPAPPTAQIHKTTPKSVGWALAHKFHAKLPHLSSRTEGRDLLPSDAVPLTPKASPNPHVLSSPAPPSAQIHKTTLTSSTQYVHVVHIVHTVHEVHRHPPPLPPTRLCEEERRSNLLSLPYAVQPVTPRASTKPKPHILRKRFNPRLLSGLSNSSITRPTQFQRKQVPPPPYLRLSQSVQCEAYGKHHPMQKRKRL